MSEDLARSTHKPINEVTLAWINEGNYHFDSASGSASGSVRARACPRLGSFSSPVHTGTAPQWKGRFCAICADRGTLTLLPVALRNAYKRHVADKVEEVSDARDWSADVPSPHARPPVRRDGVACASHPAPAPSLPTSLQILKKNPDSTNPHVAYAQGCP